MREKEGALFTPEQTLPSLCTSESEASTLGGLWLKAKEKGQSTHAGGGQLGSAWAEGLAPRHCAGMWYSGQEQAGDRVVFTAPGGRHRALGSGGAAKKRDVPSTCHLGRWLTHWCLN